MSAASRSGPRRPASDYRLVQMNLLPATVAKVDKLQLMLSARTRTDAVKTAIDIAFLVASSIREKSNVIIETDDGKRERIVIPGL